MLESVCFAERNPSKTLFIECEKAFRMITKSFPVSEGCLISPEIPFRTKTVINQFPSILFELCDKNKKELEF